MEREDTSSEQQGLGTDWVQRYRTPTGGVRKHADRSEFPRTGGPMNAQTGGRFSISIGESAFGYFQI